LKVALNSKYWVLYMLSLSRAVTTEGQLDPDRKKTPRHLSFVLLLPSPCLVLFFSRPPPTVVGLVEFSRDTGGRGDVLPLDFDKKLKLGRETNVPNTNIND
jgi:hypothetical protein